jgi:NADH-quinone oxidoreductase subunit J
MAAQIVFFVLAVVAIAASLGMLISKNPVTSALWLILDLFCIAGLYLSVNASFIAVVQILVYAGAIMVLFIFVIMLLNLSALPDVRKIEWRRFLGFILGMGVLALLTFSIASGLDVLPIPVSLETAAANGSVANLSEVLFTQYAITLEIIGILLLAATVGAVVIARKKPL